MPTGRVNAYFCLMQPWPVEFVKSSSEIDQLPSTHAPEFAFIGRSNVGKSSLINMLVGQRVAHTSAQPGKTQTINHYRVNQHWYLADLPGYGYAKVSQTQRAKWNDLIEAYFRHRQNLACVFLLIDSRIEPQNSDQHFLQWLGEQGLPLVILLTKVDQLKAHGKAQSVAVWKRLLTRTWAQLPPFIPCSSVTREGREAILEIIQDAAAQ